MTWSKYGNKKTIIDGITFDSKKEGNRYCELKLLERAGQITDLKLQVPFEICPSQQGERAIKYIADFTYTESGKKIVEDVKGKRTDVYIIKRKLFKQRHTDYEFREV